MVIIVINIYYSSNIIKYILLKFKLKLTITLEFYSYSSIKYT